MNTRKITKGAAKTLVNPSTPQPPAPQGKRVRSLRLTIKTPVKAISTGRPGHKRCSSRSSRTQRDGISWSESTWLCNTPHASGQRQNRQYLYTRSIELRIERRALGFDRSSRPIICSEGSVIRRIIAAALAMDRFRILMSLRAFSPIQ